MKKVRIAIMGTDIFRVGDFVKFLENGEITIDAKRVNVRATAISEVEIKEVGKEYEVGFTITGDFRGAPATTPEINEFFLDILHRSVGIFNEPDP